MPKPIHEPTPDQQRRIFRDFLKGLPVEPTQQKYGIDEGIHAEVLAAYAVKKHPNDVGNAEDITGDSDMIVSPLDTGATATESPIIARSPKDLDVTHEKIIKEYDYTGEVEKLRVDTGKVTDKVIAKDKETAAKEHVEAVAAVQFNLEQTEAIVEELNEVAQANTKDRQEQFKQAVKAAPSPEEVAEARKAERDRKVVAEQIAEQTIETQRTEYAKEHAEDWHKMVEAGKKQNEEEAKKMKEAKEKEVKDRKAEHDKLRKETEDDARRERERQEQREGASAGAANRGAGETPSANALREAGESSRPGQGEEGQAGEGPSGGAAGEGRRPGPTRSR
jgi:hypothetical protein